MHVDFNPTYDDWHAYVRHARITKASKAKTVALWLAAFIVLGLLMGLVALMFSPQPGMNDFALILFVIAIVFTPVLILGLLILGGVQWIEWLGYRSIRRKVLKQIERGEWNNVRLSLSEEAITAIFPLYASSHNWVKIKTIDRADHHTFFLVGSEGAYIVPDRAFSNESERDEFLNKAIEYHESAMNQPHES